MAEAYKKYYNLFSTDNIGQLGIEFFNTIGHLCDSKPKFVESDPVVLISEDLGSSLVFDDSMLDYLSYVNQIAYVGRVNDQVFSKPANDGFISYFSLDLNVPITTASIYIKNIHRILMKCANKHTAAIYRVGNAFLLAYGYRNVGKNSRSVFSDWIIDDETADTVIDSSSVWYFSFKTLSHFAHDFYNAIYANKSRKEISYETIAYEIFPLYFDEFGFDQDYLPKREDRDEFVRWYRNQLVSDFDEFYDDTFFLTKDNMLEEEIDIDIDELELQMLEAEMRGEEIIPTIGDSYEEIELSEFEQAIQIVDGGGDLSDAEDVLKQLEQADETEEDALVEFETDSTVAKSSATDLDEIFRSFQNPTSNMSLSVVSGMIEEIIDQANPTTPFKLRRTTWKRPDLYFVVEEIRGKYAYGYILDSGVVERRTSYPINSEKLKWNLQIEQEDSSQEEICYDGINAKVTFIEAKYDPDDDSMRLEFEIENYTDSELNIYLVNLCFDDEELESFHGISSVNAGETTYGTLVITDDMLKSEYLHEVSFLMFRIEIDDYEYDELETSNTLAYRFKH